MDCLRRKRLRSKIFEKKYSDEYIYAAFECDARAARVRDLQRGSNFVLKSTVYNSTILSPPL